MTAPANPAPTTHVEVRRRPVLRFGTLCAFVAVVAVSSCNDGRPPRAVAPAGTRSPIPSVESAAPSPEASGTQSSTPSAITTDDSSHRNELAHLLEQALSEWSEQHDVVGAAALIRDGGVTVREAAGLRSVNSPEPISESDVFAIGSITKTVTAVVVLELADTGVLSLDDAVADYVAGVPAAITIRDLLGHTSGYRDGDVSAEQISAVLQPGTRRTRAEQIGDIVAAGPVGAPGATHTYASANYLLLLDEVIATASESTFEEQVTKLILQPLHMDWSGFEPGDRDLASPHERPAPGQPPIDLADFDTVEMVQSSGASGALHSTVDDLDAFIQAVFHGHGFADDTIRHLTEPIVPGADYGLGLGIYDSRTGVSYGHNGRIVGYAASIRHDPEHELTVVVLSNDGSAPTAQLATELLTSLEG